MPFKNIYSKLNECKYGIFTHIHYIDRIRTYEWTLDVVVVAGDLLYIRDSRILR